MIPHVKTGRDPSRSKDAFSYFSKTSVQDVKPYLTHENLSVRFSAYRHLLNFLGLTEDLSDKQLVFTAFVEGIKDEDEGIRQYVVRRMNTFDAATYSQKTKDFILSQLNAGPKNWHTFKHIAYRTVSDGEALIN